MLKKRFLLNQPHNVSVEPLEDMFESLATIDEETWGLYEFSKDMLRDKIDNKEKMEIVIKSMECGKFWAQKMSTKLNLELCINKKATELARFLNLTINERIGRPTKFRMVFAQFVADETIEIIKEPIENYTKLVLKSTKLPSAEIVREVLIAHEIFHFLEEQFEEEMYPRQKTIKLWRLFKYEHRSTIMAASEIAAMTFAKEICSVDFVPQVLDVLLSYPMEVEFSTSIYGSMIDEVKSLHIRL